MTRFDRLEKDMPILTWDESRPIGHKTTINAKFAVYFMTTHGIPPEILEKWINDQSIFGTLDRAYHTARAYDVVHGTNIRFKLKDLINA